MKNILLILCLSLAIISCKKNGVQPKGLAGTWEMTQQSNNTTTAIITTYPHGEGNILQLLSDSTYKKFVKFKQSEEGPYRIVKKGVVVSGTAYDAIYYDNNSFAYYLVLTENELTIGNTSPNGFIWKYERRN